MQNRSGIVGNNNSVSWIVIFLIQKPYAEQHCPIFWQPRGGWKIISAL